MDNYRPVLIFCLADAGRTQGGDPPETCPCVARQAQVPEHPALRVEYPAFLQSSATAEESRRTGEGHQSLYNLYSFFYHIFFIQSSPVG